MIINDTIYSSWEISNVLNSNICEYYIYVINKFAREHDYQNITKKLNIANELYKYLELTGFLDNVREVVRNGRKYKLVGPSDYVTISKHISGISIHKDCDGYSSINGKKYNCFYKVGIYLNDLSSKQQPYIGGTYFYNEHKELTVKIKPEIGKAVIFDMREWHSGSPIPKGKTKYMMGFRLLYKRVK